MFGRSSGSKTSVCKASNYLMVKCWRLLFDNSFADSGVGIDLETDYHALTDMAGNDIAVAGVVLVYTKAFSDKLAVSIILRFFSHRTVQWMYNYCLAVANIVGKADIVFQD